MCKLGGLCALHASQTLTSGKCFLKMGLEKCRHTGTGEERMGKNHRNELAVRNSQLFEFRKCLFRRTVAMELFT
ncbi:hypothetical protein CEXT_371711 [Caerostris extrusa]|uniref:Secreted protein n=1 Tax=Caerostris extrusa TaxID=172846 RepID=A0AAV4N3E8_CAEEX|nr:hypothetical protein CEXT_371711 [Caerostris extrusa]